MIYLIVTVHESNLMLLIEYAPIIVYNHQAYLIDVLASAFARNLAIVQKRGFSR